MHPNAFIAARQLLTGIVPDSPRVLEIGSYDVNGSLRPLFPHAAAYVGIDVRPGPGVDVVADGADWQGDGQPFDLIVSTEALEHSPAPRAIIDNAYWLLRPGGWLVLTCAGPERAPHSCDGAAALPAGEHYANIEPAHLAQWLDGWQQVAILTNPAAGDIYARAQRPPAPEPETKQKTA